MKINIRNIYPYKDLKRNDDETRTYETRSGQKLASVTSILRLTQPEEKRRGLKNWRQRIGEKKADEIVKQSSLVGASLHKHLEHYVLGKNYMDDTDIGRIARPMAKEIANKGLQNLEELWGSEVHLYYPDLYAGTTDVVGIYKGKPSIIDFKQTNRPKKEEWVTDYKLQLTAYAMAHIALFNTNINTGVILMCSRDCYFQKFELTKKEFWHMSCQWIKRVAQYYDN